MLQRNRNIGSRVLPMQPKALISTLFAAIMCCTILAVTTLLPWSIQIDPSPAKPDQIAAMEDELAGLVLVRVTAIPFTV